MFLMKQLVGVFFIETGYANVIPVKLKRSDDKTVSNLFTVCNNGFAASKYYSLKNGPCIYVILLKHASRIKADGQIF